MPVKNTRKRVFGRCECCGSKTAKVTGTVYLNKESETLYIVQWTVGQPKHGMAFLILIPNQGLLASVVYSFEHGSFMVVDSEERDWSSEDETMRILDRDEIIGTPLATYLFSLIDEIWLHDRNVCKFHQKFDDQL